MIRIVHVFPELRIMNRSHTDPVMLGPVRMALFRLTDYTSTRISYMLRRLHRHNKAPKMESAYLNFAFNVR